LYADVYNKTNLYMKLWCKKKSVVVLPSNHKSFDHRTWLVLAEMENVSCGGKHEEEACSS
jgi:hypothetical protein